MIAMKLPINTETPPTKWRKKMKTFKNKNFTKRDYEATNIIFCTAKVAPNDNWIECDEAEITTSKASHLYTQDGVRYFGYL